MLSHSSPNHIKKKYIKTAQFQAKYLNITFVCMAFADCSCAAKTASDYETDEENNTQPFNPIATNGEPFPWLEKLLPNSVRPLRYMVTIHPNLTTLDVKGEPWAVNREPPDSLAFSLMQFSYLPSIAAGQVTIDLFIERETNFIVLHIQDLNVTEKVSQGGPINGLLTNCILRTGAGYARSQGLCLEDSQGAGISATSAILHWG